VALSDVPFYRGALTLQLAIIGLAICGAVVERSRGIVAVYVPYYFCAVNLALLLGMLRYLFVSESGIWRRVDR
jgi:biofilm PGA synthesis N-glycosyltransferase PgaC